MKLTTVESISKKVYLKLLVTVWLCTFFGARISAQKLRVKCWWNWQIQIPKWVNWKGSMLPTTLVTISSIFNEYLLAWVSSLKQALWMIKWHDWMLSQKNFEEEKNHQKWYFSYPKSSTDPHFQKAFKLK